MMMEGSLDFTSYIGSFIFPSQAYKCSALNIDLFGYLLFQPALLIVQTVAIGMTLRMIYNAKQKVTAIGRKEICQFFYLFILTTLVGMTLDSNVVPYGSTIYIYIKSIYIGLICATFWALFLNGFVGFLWPEDGSNKSLWSIRVSSFLIFILFGGFSYIVQSQFFEFLTPLYLVIAVFSFNALLVLTFVILQYVLLLKSTQDMWALGNLSFGLLFFICGQVSQWIVSQLACQITFHYIDGSVLAAVCNIMAIMMVYKYWDTISKEMNEYNVGFKNNFGCYGPSHLPYPAIP